jgi:Flp pilus assembly protein TadD/ribosomal protein L40E
MAEEKLVECSVCGVENLAGAAFCNGCGMKMGLVKGPDEDAEIDQLLQDLIEIEEVPTAPGEEEPLDLDMEIVDDLLDSLLIEEEGEVPAVEAGGIEEFECPMCGASLPIEASECMECGAQFEEVSEEVPVAPGVEIPAEEVPEVEVTEEVPSKLRAASGRLIDITVGVTVAALLAVFLLFGMYSWTALTPLNLGLFFGIALAGSVVGFILFQISTSAMTQADKLVKERHYAEAIDLYNRSIRMGTKPATAWTSKGVAYKRLGMYDEALRCHETALKLDPNNEIAWCNLGDVYYRQGNLPKSIECYDKALKLRPRYAIAWNNKGAALAKANRFEEAKRCQDMAVKLKPRYTVAWLNRGEVLVHLGRREEAKLCLDRAKALGA